MSPIISLDSTFGALSIGFNVSCVMFGVLTAQTYIYFRGYFSSDRPIYMILVTLLWILECADQVASGHSVYYYTITNYGNLRILLASGVVWSLLIQVVLGVVVGTIVKICFLIRLWRFSNHNILITGTILLLVLTQFGAAIAFTVQGFRLSGLIYFENLSKIATISLGAAVLTDVTIAAALCFYLRRIRKHTSSSSLAHTLIIYAISTGALTGAVNVCTLILYNAHSDAFYFMASYFVLGKLYVILFISALDTRSIIRGKHIEGTSRMANLGNSHFTTSSQAGPSLPSSQQHIKSMEIGMAHELPGRADAPRHSELDGGHPIAFAI